MSGEGVKMTIMLDRIRSEAPQWRDRVGRTPIPMDRWGKDHWSLLLYVEDRAVNRHGLIDWNNLTLSQGHWPMLWAARNRWASASGEDAADKYGLRLRSPEGAIETVKGCCEGDALMDLVDAGLVAVTMPPLSSTGKSYLRPDGHALNDPSPDEPVTGRVEWALMPWARFGLTEQGWELAGAVRRHRGNGGRMATFVPEQGGPQ